MKARRSIRRAGRGTPVGRTNVTLPPDLKDRMAGYPGPVNWSALAQEAWRRFLDAPVRDDLGGNRGADCRM